MGMMLSENNLCLFCVCLFSFFFFYFLYFFLWARGHQSPDIVGVCIQFGSFYLYIEG